VPELPDIESYLAALRTFVVGQRLDRVRLASPFLLRSVEPPLSSFEGGTLLGVRRLGKRIVLRFDTGASLVLHLMIAGRLHWKAKGAKIGGRYGLAAFDFESGSLLFTEASPQHRASLHAVSTYADLRAWISDAIEPLEVDERTFAGHLRRENHTLKRALTDPKLVSGIGNAYSDEILHAARLSPVLLTGKASDEELARLYVATQRVLSQWRDALVAEARKAFPEKVTAFREGMAVHGRYGKPCPACGAPVQRIVYAENEANYCARCQTGGKILADRSLSRLLHKDWPRTIEEWEGKMGKGTEPAAGEEGPAAEPTKATRGPRR
jgi:formamidopyrimidine-DNA glycosylase